MSAPKPVPSLLARNVPSDDMPTIGETLQALGLVVRPGPELHRSRGLDEMRVAFVGSADECCAWIEAQLAGRVAS